MTSLPELRRVAEEAGPDHRDGGFSYFATPKVHAFVEKFRPSVVLSLLDRIEKAEAGLTLANEETDKANAIIDQLRLERDVRQKIQAQLDDRIEKAEANLAAETTRADDVALSVEQYGKENYDIGKREGREMVIQDLDAATGGDGEYRSSDIPERDIDEPAMQARIVRRFIDLRAALEKAEADREALAAWMILHGFATGHGDDVKSLLGELEWQMRERREKAEALLREALLVVKNKHVHTLPASDCTVCRLLDCIRAALREETKP